VFWVKDRQGKVKRGNAIFGLFSWLLAHTRANEKAARNEKFASAFR
jgi:hypothetical protein